ncbi:PREDICTED: uncharacterized protein LOC106744531 [Dinoponera quadriceps]|uniref:Uncharacterized protein LOC106744531 n=1 Tax=Dinoponera quadriceps TaxID=609295 RepID=A0A6P3X9D8_DINQU|nr:PREDICTED: uncharacterized protein LOC106744531 [Dinoponera quadriceps]
MEAVRKAKERLRQYPALIAKCHESASKYASCVLAKSNLEKNACAAEFDELKRCLVKAAVASGNTKL